MIQRLLLAPALLLATAAWADIDGTWTAHAGATKLQLRLTADDRWNSSFPVALPSLTGLAPDAVGAATRTPVEFKLQRDAGSFSFTGHFKENDGAGFFRFTGDSAFEQRLRDAGVKVERKNGREFREDDLLSLALFDVSTAFVGELHAVGLRDLSLDDLTSMRIHGATPEFVRQMQSLGYRGDVDDYVTFRIHGVTAGIDANYVNALRRAGKKNE